MEKIIAIGDFHIPTRAKQIPSWIVNFIRDYKPEYLLCTGDLTQKQVLDDLYNLAKNVYIVKGNCDFLDLPLKFSIKIEWLKFGLFHGSGVYPRGNPNQLYDVAKSMNVDVLITGHTHNPKYYSFGDVVIINPGSATGVWSGGGPSIGETFAKLEIEDKTISISFFINGKEARSYTFSK